jgi:LCP family protein required for cell wall assembly
MAACKSFFFQSKSTTIGAINMKKVLLIIGIVLTLFIGAAGGYAVYLYNNAVSTVDEGMHAPTEREHSEKREQEVNIETREPLSFLLLGLDEDDFSGRSDTILVVTVNPNDNSMKMTSVPRDTRLEIPGRGSEDKVNHAHAYGGPQLVMETVEDFLDVPIDYYVAVNMSGFRDIVNSVGGVTVENTFAFEKRGHEYPEGEISMNGEEALHYVRMRKEDPDGDLGRNARQRKVLDAIIDEAASFSSVTRVEHILQALGDNIRTDMTFDEMWEIYEKYGDARHNTESVEIDGSGTLIDEVWYYLVEDEERRRVSEDLRTHLELDKDHDVSVREDDTDEMEEAADYEE